MSPNNHFNGLRAPFLLLRRHGVLLMLTLVYTIAFVDRQVLAILQESVKRDLHLSDGQLGLLTGFSFALFYAGFGLPIARIADRWIRRDVIAISMLIWSAMTAATGLAQSFVQLLLARMGVGVGEAGCSPPSYSLIADLYALRHRAAALSFFNIGSNFGMLFGFLLGGWLDQAFGWRIAFLMVGLPGIVVAAALRLFVAEPPRPPTQVAATSLVSGLRYLASKATLLRLSPAISFSAIAAYGAIMWTAPYLIRVHHMSPVQVGTALALGLGVGGILGGLASGFVADRLAARDLRWYLWLPALSSVVMAPLFCAAFLAPDGQTALLFLIVPFLLAGTYGGTTLSVFNGIAPAELRATASALYLLIANIFGLGLGVWVIGVISDHLVSAFGIDSLRYSLVIVIPAACILAALHYLHASRTIRGELPEASAPGRKACEELAPTMAPGQQQ